MRQHLTKEQVRGYTYSRSALGGDVKEHGRYRRVQAPQPKEFPPTHSVAMSYATVQPCLQRHATIRIWREVRAFAETSTRGETVAAAVWRTGDRRGSLVHSPTTKSSTADPLDGSPGQPVHFGLHSFPSIVTTRPGQEPRRCCAFHAVEFGIHPNTSQTNFKLAAITYASGQGLQKGYEVLLFASGEVERTNSGVETGVALSSTIVELDNVIQCREAAVVHVGRGSAHFAERGRLEGAAVSGGLSDDGAPFIRHDARSPGDASVVEVLVREVWPCVALAAACLAME